MNVDANVKKFWPLIVCAMLGLAAYFQASAIGSLISANLGGEPYVPQPVATAVVDVDAPPAAGPILERNPFDSSAGPIEEPEREPSSEDGPAPVEGTSECSTGRVVLIAQNDDPNWAFASIDSGSGEAQLRRVGDTFGDFQLMSLTWDRVYLEEKGNACFLSMGGSRRNTAKTERWKDRPSAAAPKPAPEPAEAEGGFKKTADNRFTTDRASLQKMLSGTGFLGKSRITPVKEGDAVVGLKMGRVDEESALGQLGMEPGDVLQSISGTQINDPEKLRVAYERMKDAPVLRFMVERDGVRKQIKVTVK